MDAGSAQAMRDHITLLHVSDPQFGRNHRFGNLALPPDDTFDTSVAERLTEGLYSALEPDRTGTMLS
jgi:hypothetical protein